MRFSSSSSFKQMTIYRVKGAFQQAVETEWIYQNAQCQKYMRNNGALWLWAQNISPANGWQTNEAGTNKNGNKSQRCVVCSSCFYHVFGGMNFLFLRARVMWVVCWLLSSFRKQQILWATYFLLRVNSQAFSMCLLLEIGIYPRVGTTSSTSQTFPSGIL